jgi:Taurine catabolism dioxygenase TauD, TfdA family
MKTIALEPTTAHQWRQALKAYDTTDSPTSTMRELRAIGAALLPHEVTDPISTLTSAEADRCVLVKGIPTEGTRIDDLCLVSLVEASQWRVFAFAEQNNGDLVQTITPIPGREAHRSNARRVPLGWHAGDAILHRNHRTEGIALLCIDNTAEAETRYVSTSAIVPNLAPDTIDTLCSPLFRFPTPESFTVFGGKLIYSEPRPVLTRTGNGYEIACALYNLMPLTGNERARTAVTELQVAVAAATSSAVRLEPGDCLLFSNIHGLHCRDQVNGRRLLKRVYFRNRIDHMTTKENPTGLVFQASSLILAS